MSVVDLVHEVHGLFAQHHIEHAFGGALALAYYAEPRGTLDVDVNVFASFESAPRVVSQLDPLGLEPDQAPEDWSPIAGVRLGRTGDPIHLDLFFSVDDRYREIARRKRRFPFGPEQRRLPFLSAEDLVIFKLSFGRDKDWVDLRQVVRARPNIDLAYVERQLVGLRGPTMYPRMARLRQLVRQAGERGSP